MPQIRYIDLFSGLGAFHQAFNTNPDFHCVAACDIDEGARKIYEANFGLKPEGDIRDLAEKAANIPDFELLCAGFPCQPFSIAGNGEGFKDKVKGNLFYDILKIIDVKKPRMCILENVKNLETHDEGKTFQTIRQELVDRGYSVTARVLNSAEYGSPQQRERIFIFATLSPFEFPTNFPRYRTVVTILEQEEQENELDGNKYYLIKKKGPRISIKTPNCLYDVYSFETNKGGRQGERVYDPAAAGITICASSGGPGAKTGLYLTAPNVVRRLNVKETLQMFGFPTTYKFPDTTDEHALFYLGNSIVVNVPTSFIPAVLGYFSA
jgi:DNA (cytosine-5)-methyltransferase 1